MTLYQGTKLFYSKVNITGGLNLLPVNFNI